MSVVLGVFALSGCSSASRAELPKPKPSLIVIPYSTTAPVVVVAIDNHFHDIHPSDHRVISADQRFTVRNDGAYRHNFTVVGTDISVYLEPDEQVTWARIGDELPPGTYAVICKIHQNVGMGGRFRIIPGS